MCCTKCVYPMAQWVKNPPGIQGFDSWFRKILWRRKSQPTLVPFSEKSHGQRSLMSYSTKGCKESNTTEWLTMYALYKIQNQGTKNVKSSQPWREGNSTDFNSLLSSLHLRIFLLSTTLSFSDSAFSSITFCTIKYRYMKIPDFTDSIQFSHSVMSDALQPHGLQHARLPYPSPSPGACSNLCPLSQWCHPTILSSVIPFSSCLQYFPALESFPISWFFASGGQSTGASASASVFPMNIQDSFPLGLTGLVSLHSQGLSRVFSNTTGQKHRFFGTQLSLCYNSHIHIWQLEKP